MTKLLEQAIEALRKLPPQRQDELAEGEFPGMFLRIGGGNLCSHGGALCPVPPRLLTFVILL